MGGSLTMIIRILTAAVLTAGLAASPAAAAKDPVVARTVTAICVGSSRNPVPQDLLIELSAVAVRTSTQDLATCTSALKAVRRLGGYNRPTKGYQCVAEPLEPEQFVEHNVCVLNRSGTTVRLRFDLILD